MKMKSFVIGLSLAAVAASTFASDERSAAKVVKKYSEAVACEITDIQDQRNQYKAVKVFQGDPEMNGLGNVFVVFWQGDVGCAGGNGTIIPTFTVVEHTGHMSADPVVITDFKFPEMEMVYLTNFSGKNGQIQISGVSYGPKDQQHSPTKKVSYTLKLDLPNRAFVLLNR